ncbi:MAG: B12-binding domain-containing radical SAM protein [Thermoplasmatales archaeon]|nr:MAG: B12-binding domain-containing radical SAM protein [Thermoplasmatales archaeon]
MKFLLVRAGDLKDNIRLFAPSTHPPLGLLNLGAVLEQDGHDVEILDFFMENISREQLGNALMSSDAVGMSFYTAHLSSAMDISRMIKDVNPDIPLIIGGPHCIFVKERSLLDIPHADISVISEGEQVIVDIVRYLEGRKKLADIHGVFYRDNNRIKKGKTLEIIEDLDSLYFPARHLVDKYDYGSFPFGLQLKKKVTAMITSRGCPFNCRFCPKYDNIIDGWGFRQRSAENILQEFEDIDDKYGSVLIVDDNFLVDKKRALRIFDGLIDMGTEVELFIDGARVDSADKKLYQKMKKAGVKYIYYGLESGNQEVLDFYNKKTTLSQIRKAINLSRKMNFITMGNFIFGAPIEKKEHIERTIKFACSLPLDVVTFQPLAYLYRSQLWNDAVERDIISKDTLFVFADSEKGLGNLPGKELKEYSNIAFQRFYLRSTYIFSQIYRSILRNDYNLLINGLKFLLWLKRNRYRWPKQNPQTH